VTLPVDGEYTLEVMLDNLNTAGEYRLLLLPGVAMTVEPGAFVPAPGLDIEVVLIWNTPADLDLAVHAPGGDAPPIQRANDFCQAPVLAPVERLTWEQDAAAPGLYQVGVIYRFNCAGLDEPVQFLLALVRDGAVMDIIGGTPIPPCCLTASEGAGLASGGRAGISGFGADMARIRRRVDVWLTRIAYGWR
jgi:hypothetical protein